MGKNSVYSFQLAAGFASQFSYEIVSMYFLFVDSGLILWFFLILQIIFSLQAFIVRYFILGTNFGSRTNWNTSLWYECCCIFIRQTCLLSRWKSLWHLWRPRRHGFWSGRLKVQIFSCWDKEKKKYKSNSNQNYKTLKISWMRCYNLH